jgi:hypothetical protein
MGKQLAEKDLKFCEGGTKYYDRLNWSTNITEHDTKSYLNQVLAETKKSNRERSGSLK